MAEEEELCPICGIGGTYDDDDGQTYCNNGHNLGHGPRIGEDDDDFGRRGQSHRVKDKDPKQKASKVLHGRKAYQLFLQCLQFILWKQCHVLIAEKGMPTELFSIVRDLWTLRISKLAERLRGDPNMVQQSGEETSEDQSSTSRPNTDSEVPTPKYLKDPRSRKSDRNPTLLETTAIIYVGLLLLRWPISVSTIAQWIVMEELPFIRVIRYLPQEMVNRLPGEYQRHFNSVIPFKAEDLHAALLESSLFYSTNFGMVTPSISHIPIMMSYLRILGLPLEVYSLVKRLNSMTNFNFTYPANFSNLRSPTRYPEAQLMSLVVVATKLLLPFDSDDLKRYPKLHGDVGALKMDWPSWSKARKSLDFGQSESGLKRGTEMLVKDSDILDMDDEQLDQYMDWYQQTWIKHQRTNHPLQEILDMFPLKDLVDQEPSRRDESEEAEQEIEFIKDVQSHLRTISPVSNDEDVALTPILRPGMRYTQFRTISALPQVAKEFHQEAANLCGLTLEALLRAVMHTENLVMTWRRAKRRADFFGDEMDLEAETGTVAAELGKLDIGVNSDMDVNMQIDQDLADTDDNGE